MSVEIVAEISNNHNGSLTRAMKLVEAAAKCGANTLKLQAYLPDELVALRGDGPAPEPWGSQGWSMRRLYEKAATPFEWFPLLTRYATDCGLQWFSSVFGSESLAMLESLGCPRYKIAALDNQQRGLLDAAANTWKPLIVSAANGSDVRMPYLRGRRWDLLYCPPGYPTPLDEVYLPFFGDWSDCGIGDNYLGLSSHCLAPELPIAAVVRGAKLLEYHFMLDAEPSELEANVSLNETQFTAMVRSVRATESLLG